eukprot:Selendium_serpulae@DN6255_c1_g8_i1.p1
MRAAALWDFVMNEPLGNMVLWADVDIVFTKNPFKYELPDLNSNQLNIWLSSDSPIGERPDESVCGGLYYIRIAEDTRNLFKVSLDHLTAGRTYDGMDQGSLDSAVRKTRINKKWLPRNTFMNGRSFFLGGTNEDNTVAVHFNWIFNLSVKVELMKVAGLWYGSPVEGRRIYLTSDELETLDALGGGKNANLTKESK